MADEMPVTLWFILVSLAEPPPLVPAASPSQFYCLQSKNSESALRQAWLSMAPLALEAFLLSCL